MIEEFLSRFAKRQQIGPPGYMTRWFLMTLGPLLEVYLHRFNAGDQGRDSHDHPWLLNITIVLKGGYYEDQFQNGTRVGGHMVEHGAVRFGRAEHRIAETDGETWTLFVGLFRWRNWGFWKANGAFIHNDEYVPDEN